MSPFQGGNVDLKLRDPIVDLPSPPSSVGRNTRNDALRQMEEERRKKRQQTLGFDLDAFLRNLFGG